MKNSSEKEANYGTVSQRPIPRRQRHSDPRNKRESKPDPTERTDCGMDEEEKKNPYLIHARAKRFTRRMQRGVRKEDQARFQ